MLNEKKRNGMKKAGKESDVVISTRVRLAKPCRYAVPKPHDA